jgi:hypothetical protein
LSHDPAVLGRVRKLLALAGSPNVHEAASAAAAAQALVERHRLADLLSAEADVAADPVTDGRAAPLEAARRLRRWKIVLAAGLAEANACLAYTAAAGDETLLLLAGRDADRAAVAAIWEWLVQRLEWLSATHGPGRSRHWHEAFRIGAAEVIVARLAAVGAEEVATLPPAALVRVEPARQARAAAVDAFAEQHLHLGRGRSLRVDGRGLARGREAGAAMGLPPRR